MERTAAAPNMATANRGAGFSQALRYALAVPAVAWCAAAMVALGTPPRSGYQVPSFTVMLVAGAIEMLIVPVAVSRLAANPSLRTRGNVMLTVLGGLCLLSWIAIYVFVVTT